MNQFFGVVYPLIFLIAFSVPITAKSAETWESTQVLAAAAVDAGDCATAWKLIWPWARSGNIKARALLAGGMVAVGLIPPGSGQDALSRYRHAVIFGVYGAAGGERTAIEQLHALIGNGAVADLGGQKLDRCLGIDRDPQDCVTEAVTSGFVPDFDAYAREIDAAANLPGAGAASCMQSSVPARP